MTGAAATVGDQSVRPVAHPSRAAVASLVCLVAVPVALLFWIVWRYGVDVPADDSWHMVHVFRRVWTGQAGWSDFFGQVNESRLPFPKLVLFGLALLTDWNVKAELYLQQATMALLLIVLYFLGRRTLGFGPVLRLAVLAGTSLMLYSLVQHQNPLWGIQFIVFVPPLCLAFGALVTYAAWRMWTKRIVAAVACVVGMYSFSNGIGLWVFVPAIVESVGSSEPQPTQGPPAPRLDFAGLAFWVACGVVAAWAFFRDYQRPPWHPKMTVALEHPWDAVRAFLLFLGSPVYDGTTRHLVPLVFGSAELCLVAVVVGVFAVNRRSPGFLRAAAPWLAFAGFGVLAGALIVAGRLGFSPEYSLSARYVAFAAWVEIGLLHLVALLLTRRDILRTGTALRRTIVAGSAVLGLGFLWLHAIASVAAFPEYPKLRVERLQAKAALWLVDVTPQPDIQRLVWYGSYPGSTRALGMWLDERGYLRPRLLHDLSAAARDESLPQDIGWLDTAVRQPDGSLRVTGWCNLPWRREACDAVLVTARLSSGLEVACTVLFPAELRTDVATYLAASPASIYGWGGDVVCQPDAETLRFWAVDMTKPRLALLRSSFGREGTASVKGAAR